MARGKLYPVVAVDHPERGETVYCWGTNAGVTTVRACLVTHPKEEISVKVVMMTEKQFDAMDDYEGEC